MRIGITGHRGLSRGVEQQVRQLLGEAVRELDPTDLVGISCIADGPDAWFASAVLKHGGSLEVVVPAEQYRESLPEDHWPVYDELMRHAAEVHHTGMTASDSQAHMAGSEILVRLSDKLFAVWDEKPARGYGGTADVVGYAQRNGVPVRVLWPKSATRE